MTIKNATITTDYVIDVATGLRSQHTSIITGSLLYSEDFNSSTIDQLPAGWDTQNTDSATGGGAEVKSEITGDATTNRALLLRGQVMSHTTFDDPPVAAGNWRWVALTSQTFTQPINVRFKVYQGRSSGLYSATEAPDAGEDLLLQYKVGTGSWKTAGLSMAVNSDPNGGSWDLDEFVVRIINDGVDASNPISLRWIFKTNVSDSQDDNDLWAIDDIQVHASLGDIPKRFTVGVAANIRGQSTTTPYKTFLGEQKS